MSRAASRALVLAAGAVACGVLAFAAVAQEERSDEEPPDLSAYEEAAEDAVARGLDYLAAAQKENGAFPAGWGDNTGITSLCVMAFLAKGHTPGAGPHGETVNRGIDFVLDSRQENGMLVGSGRSHGPMYSHAIATLLLSEVSGMLDAERQRRVDACLPEALRLILAAQQVEKLQASRGGWRYTLNSADSDISCTGWPLMALRSARNSGAPVPAEAIDYALEFVMRCRTRDGGFAYMPGQGPGPARTGVGLLCLELCGRHRDEAALAAGDWLLNRPPRHAGEQWYYYGIYYGSQGMFQLGDDYWKPFAARMYETLLANQREDGSWPKGSAGREGECYATAMSILAMSVPYCQLPIYQR
jgi:hypothetical protein